MFTGIVEEVGKVNRIISSPIFQVNIKATKIIEDLSISDSICVNGVCLTVTDMSTEDFTVEVMSQTLKKTNLHVLQAGDKVNLERALLPTSRLGGHMLTGDIDGLASLEKIVRTPSQWTVTLRPPFELMRYIVPQGRVALEGVSLTVAERNKELFKVCLIPYTINNTNFCYKQESNLLNLEVDILGKHVENILSFQDKREGMSTRFLREAGY